MKKDEARRRLMEERFRIEQEVAALEDGLGESLEDSSEESMYDQHMAETASATLDREMDLSLEENAEVALARIDRALAKLDGGSYGICDSCKGRIDDGRLRAVPSAALCIDCQRRQERER